MKAKTSKTLLNVLRKKFKKRVSYPKLNVVSAMKSQASKESANPKLQEKDAHNFRIYIKKQGLGLVFL